MYRKLVLIATILVALGAVLPVQAVEEAGDGVASSLVGLDPVVVSPLAASTLPALVGRSDADSGADAPYVLVEVDEREAIERVVMGDGSIGEVRGVLTSYRIQPLGPGAGGQAAALSGGCGLNKYQAFPYLYIDFGGNSFARAYAWAEWTGSGCPPGTLFSWYSYLEEYQLFWTARDYQEGFVAPGQGKRYTWVASACTNSASEDWQHRYAGSWSGGTDSGKYESVLACNN